MATLIEMRDITRQYERAYGRRRQHTETVTDDTSDPLLIPVDAETVAVAVTPGTSARVEYSLSSYANIEADTAAWHAWDDGDVTSATTSAIDARVTALRLVSTGASNWEVTA